MEERRDLHRDTPAGGTARGATRVSGRGVLSTQPALEPAQPGLGRDKHPVLG